MVHLGNDWDEILAGEFQKEYYLRLRQILKQEYCTQTIYPSMYDLFNALRFTPCSQVKVVIIGQDPYHGPGRPTGFPFPCRKECRSLPPSRIFSRSCRTT